MRDPEHEEAGKRCNAAGPEVAKVVSPASPPTSENEETPDEAAHEREVINGDDLLKRVRHYVGRFVIHPSPIALDAHVLWIVHTHLMDSSDTTPRLAILSPEPGSGKSRLLEITALLVPRPILSVQSTSAYIIRKIADQANRPTLLCDETDAIFGPQGRGNEDLRAAINAGYRRGATIGRCQTVRNNPVPQELMIYGAMALGGLGDLPDTIMSRSIVIRMRKRMNGQNVEAYREQVHGPEGWALRDELERWAASIAELAKFAEPAFPEGIADRDADVWGPLLVVADLAGGDWPSLARAAASDFVFARKNVESPTLGVQLLNDIRSCFGDADRLPSQELIAMLLADEEGPWGDIKGKRLNPRELAKMLRGYDIRPIGLRMDDNSTPRGYRPEQFYESWRRYLPGPVQPATAATSATSSIDERKSGVSAVADSGGTMDCCGSGSDVAPTEAS